MKRTNLPMNLIQKTKAEIDAYFAENPTLIPNKTLLRWVEEYAFDCFVILQDRLLKDPLYDQNKDIYHQEFQLLKKYVQEFLNEHKELNFHTASWLSKEMQESFLKINRNLKPSSYTRHK